MKRTPDRSRRPPVTGRLALIAALSALASSAQAQSVQDYRLPPAPSPTATAAGPVDSDHPVAAPTKTTPAPEPTAAPPVIAPPPPGTATSAVRPSAAPAPRATPSPRTETQATPSSTPTAAPLPTAEPMAVPTAVASEPAPAPSSAPIPAVATPEENEHWLWIAVAAALVLILGGLLRWRGRARGNEAVEYQPEADLVPAPSSPASPARREPPPAPAPATPAAPPQDAELRPLEMQLEARHLSRAMVNATLAYRLTLTNRSDASTGPLRIAGDIVSAHASLSAAEQLAPAEAALAAIHEVSALAPGESVTLSGELRMPIASILPINSGGARVFVPLARFRAEMPESATTRVFVIGQASEQPGGALRPFPLDRGPGVDRALDQRELEMPA